MKKNCFTRTNSLRVMWTPVLLLAMTPLVAMSQSEPQAPNATAAPVPTPAAPAGSAERVPAITQPKSLVMVDSSSYVIGAEDALQVTVWKEPTLTGTFPVRPDGMISMVLVGDVPAAGLTPMQLGKNMEARLKQYIQDPSVSVVVTAANSHRIFGIGQ